MCQAHLGWFRHILDERSSILGPVKYLTLDWNFKLAVTFTWLIW